MTSMIGGIVSITLGALMFATVFMPQVKGANTTGWTSSETSLWGILGLVGIIGMVLGTLSVFGVI